MDLIDVILKECPAFHRAETEINRAFDPSESYLPQQTATRLAKQESACYGIEKDVAFFIRNSINPLSQTLETGAGVSTLIFAIEGAMHTAITPNLTEVELIKKYASKKNINLDHVSFFIESSDQFLPKFTNDNLDLVFLDGKHAFPWPIVDWFYLADRIKTGGIMIVDDAQINSVRIIVDFMSTDPHWLCLKSFNNKTFAFRKESDSIHDIAWHMQPYNFRKQVDPSIFRNIKSILKYVMHHRIRRST